MAKRSKKKKLKAPKVVRTALYLNVSKEEKENLVITEENGFYEKEPGVFYKILLTETYVDVCTEAAKPEFQRVIRDAMNGKFDLIITDDICMFTGNATITLHYCKMLKEKNVEVVFQIMGCSRSCHSFCENFEAEIRKMPCFNEKALIDENSLALCSRCH